MKKIRSVLAGLALAGLAAPLLAQDKTTVEKSPPAFATRLRFANSWTETQAPGELDGMRAATTAAEAQAILARWRTQALAGLLRSVAERLQDRAPSGNARDPLEVDLVLRGETVKGKPTLKLVVDKVRYWDDRGRDWTLEPARPDARERATKLVKDVALEWRRVFSGRIEREMMEEQLLGAALVLVHGVALELDSKDALTPEAEKQLQERLGADFPGALVEHVRWFLREAQERARLPLAPALPSAGKVEIRGVTYEVVKTGKAKGRATAHVVGHASRPGVGLELREELTVDVQTGLVIEGRSGVLREGLYGRSMRFGSVRWEIEAVKPAS